MSVKHMYIAIDLKTFYASVECVTRGLDPLDTNLVVADASRTEKTICLAVSPSLKSYGISGRARLFEVVSKVNEGIIVMAATNRVDILDPAILRPGRFDRKIVVGRPDVKGRLEILKVHARKKPLGDDVDLDSLSRTTAGFTGADLENLLNEAAIYAARNGRRYISNSDVNYAFVKVGIGKFTLLKRKKRKILPLQTIVSCRGKIFRFLIFSFILLLQPLLSPVHQTEPAHSVRTHTHKFRCRRLWNEDLYCSQIMKTLLHLQQFPACRPLPDSFQVHDHGVYLNLP